MVLQKSVSSNAASGFSVQITTLLSTTINPKWDGVWAEEKFTDLISGVHLNFFLGSLLPFRLCPSASPGVLVLSSSSLSVFPPSSFCGSPPSRFSLFPCLKHHCHHHQCKYCTTITHVCLKARKWFFLSYQSTSLLSDKSLPSSSVSVLCYHHSLCCFIWNSFTIIISVSIASSSLPVLLHLKQ